jgi:hypothetical protein
MGYRGRLLNEVVEVRRKATTDDGVAGKIPEWTSVISRYHCRIYKPASETTYEDEGMRDESLFTMMGLKRFDVRTGDKVVRNDGVQFIVTSAKRAKRWWHPYFNKYSLREIQSPTNRPGMD